MEVTKQLSSFEPFVTGSKCFRDEVSIKLSVQIKESLGIDGGAMGGGLKIKAPHLHLVGVESIRGSVPVVVQSRSGLSPFGQKSHSRFSRSRFSR